MYHTIKKTPIVIDFFFFALYPMCLRPLMVCTLLLYRNGTGINHNQVGCATEYVGQQPSAWDRLVKTSPSPRIHRLQSAGSRDLVEPDPGASSVFWPEVTTTIAKNPL